MAATNPILEKFQKKYFDKEFRALTWTGTFEEYLEIVKKNPRILRTSYQRLYDMILSFGTEDYEDSRKKMIHYNFFDDPVDNGKDAVYGLDAYLMKLMNALKSAAYRYGTEKRVLLLHGPVGSSKSTIVRLMKKGLEHYSRTEDGAIYSYEWIDIPKHFEEAGTSPKETVPCPMHQDPLFLVPDRLREEFMTEVLGDKAKEIYMEGSLNPTCRQIYREMLKVYDGDWTKVLQHVRVKRILLSEKDRI
ncbi:MAG: serine/threonine protein kinase, partial [Calditrichaeota bacterium]|nr:serine/threonine protein kinase [Calditrichota bacterium]